MTYVGGDIDEAPAVTRRELPAGGRAWYVSTALAPDAMDALVTRIADDSGARPILPTPPPAGIEVAERQSAGERFLFLLNHGETEQVVDVSGAAGSPWMTVTGRVPAGDSVLVGVGDVVVLVTSTERTPDS